MGRYILATLLACLFLYPNTVPAHEEAQEFEVPRLFGTFAPQPGAWSEYDIFDKSIDRRARMRMAIVGVEDGSYWYEVVNEEGATRNIVKMLVKGDPNDPEHIQRLIMKSGDGPAREMPRDFVLMGRRMAVYMFELRSGIPAASLASLQNVKTGEEEVTVPAGTFAVTLHRIVDAAGQIYAEYKFSPEVSPFGVVYSEAGKTTMVLLGHGTGAESLISEEPVMMSQPPGMPEGMLRGMVPGMSPPEGMGPDQGGSIRQIPGMGTGYEPKQ